MTNPLKQELTDLWEIWIEYDPYHPLYFGTLYITGEVITNKKSPVPAMIKSGEIVSSQLRLIIPSCMEDSPREIREICYSEPVVNLNQYTSVCIVSGDETIAHFEEIEIVI